MPQANYPWFVRGGGGLGLGSPAGTFAFHNTSGDAASHYGFRPVLAVNAGL
jgi:hypothetical protein